MKKYFLLTFCCLLFYDNLFSQNISSILQLNKSYDIKENSHVKKVIIDIIFYDLNGSEIKKEETTLNLNNKILTQSKFNGSGLTERITRRYDSEGNNCVWEHYETWNDIVGYTEEISDYEYDENGYLIKIEVKNQFNKALRDITILNNEKGLPVELIVKSNNKIEYEKELAEYNYDGNIVSINSLDKNGHILSKNECKIDDAIPDADDVYNKSGDLIKSGEYEYDYSYFKHKSWTKKREYKLINEKRLPIAEYNRRIIFGR